MTASDEAAQILIRVFEALARQNGKTLAQATREDIRRACDLLTQGDGLEELLEDIPARQSPGEQAINDPQFQKWRAARAGER